jgi:hypothetical protein
MTRTEQRMQAEIKALKQTVGTLIAWMAQSSVSPIRIDEAKTLLKMLEQSNAD